MKRLRSKNAGNMEPPEQQMPPEGQESTEAVDKFDQLGNQADPQQEQYGEAVRNADPDRQQVISNVNVLMEQWLESIEGDPAFLLRNRFMLEERRRARPSRSGGPLYESRPW